MSGLEAYLDRPMTSPAAEVLDAIEAGPIDPADALSVDALDRLLDPTPMPAETGWCTLPDGCGYVAVATPMPGVTGEMIDWWFDWHPHESIRYRIWHPKAHISNSVEMPSRRGAKAHWDTVHHPVEDVGVGVVRARIGFHAPSAMGFSTDALDDPRVATIVCGYAGDDQRHVRHTPMCHVFLATDDGVLLRSRFWLGAALRPYAPEPLASIGERLINRRAVRVRALPSRLPCALATHCAEEYANLGSLLGELYARFGGDGA
jgi:DAPG hydrolase PhiG domain